MSLRKKEAISAFVQSGNYEFSSVTGFEPGTLRVTVLPLIHYTRFPYRKKSKKKFVQTLREFCNFSEAESPVGSKNNRQFRLKRQKTRIVHNF